MSCEKVSASQICPHSLNRLLLDDPAMEFPFLYQYPDRISHLLNQPQELILLPVPVILQIKVKRKSIICKVREGVEDQQPRVGQYFRYRYSHIIYSK